MRTLSDDTSLILRAGMSARLLGVAEYYPEALDVAERILSDISQPLDREFLVAVAGQSYSTSRVDQLISAQIEAYPPRNITEAGQLLEDLDFAKLRVSASAVCGVLVRLHRQVLEGRDVAGQHDLIAILHEYANYLLNADRPEAALAPCTEAIKLCRELESVDPDKGRSGLAHQLFDYSRLLNLTRDYDGSRRAAQESVDLYRDLANSKAEVYQHEFAAALEQYAMATHKVSATRDAIPIGADAIAIYKQLARGDQLPDECELPHALTAQATFLDVEGHHSEAVNLADELGAAVVNYATTLLHSGRTDEAVVAIKEAIEIYRHLAASNPKRWSYSLAGSLSNYGDILRSNHQSSSALVPEKEAVTIFRRLFRAGELDPEDLGGALQNYAGSLDSSGKLREAQAPIAEALQIFRDLAKEQPTKFSAKLALALNTHGIIQSRAGNDHAALLSAKEAVLLYRRLYAADEDAFQEFLAGALWNYAGCVAVVDSQAAAIALAEEAVGLFRELFLREPAAYANGFAPLLNGYRDLLISVQRQGDADKVAVERAQVMRWSRVGVGGQDPLVDVKVAQG